MGWILYAAISLALLVSGGIIRALLKESRWQRAWMGVTISVVFAVFAWNLAFGFEQRVVALEVDKVVGAPIPWQERKIYYYYVDAFVCMDSWSPEGLGSNVVRESRSKLLFDIFIWFVPFLFFWWLVMRVPSAKRKKQKQPPAAAA